MKATKRKLNFIIEKTDTGFSVFSEKYPIYSTGRNISELYTNIAEAATLYFEDQEVIISSANINLEIDLKQFFTHYRVLNAKFLAERIGMSESLLSQYVNGHKKPSKKQTERILKGIHEIGKELLDIHLIAN